MPNLTVHHRINVRPPDGQGNPYEYSERLFADYGFRKMQFVFSAKPLPFGTFIDLDRETLFRQIKAAPPLSLVEINLEGAPWVLIDGATGMVRVEVRERLIGLLNECRRIRPDCLYGYYAKCPTSRFFWEVGTPWKNEPAYLHLSEAADQSLIPLAASADALFPEFYLEHQLPVDACERYLFQVIQRAKRLYPGKRIIPHLWPMWYSWWRENQKCHEWPLDAWTPAVIESALIPGDYWARMLRVIVEVCGVHEIMIWGQGLLPWKEYPWFLETIKLI